MQAGLTSRPLTFRMIFLSRAALFALVILVVDLWEDVEKESGLKMAA